MPSSSAEAPGAPIRWGYAWVAVIDATTNLVAFRPTGAPATAIATAVLFASGHVVALGLLLGAFADLGWRLSRRRYVGLAAALLSLAAITLFVLNDELSVFDGILRPVLMVASFVPLAALIVRWRWVGARPWVARACAVLGTAVAAVHPHLLAVEYEGVHLFATLAAGLIVAAGVPGVPRGRLEALRARVPALGRTVLLAAVCSASALTLAVWPSNTVLVVMGMFPNASLVPTLASLRDFSAGFSIESVPPDQRQWFVSRQSVAPIPPSPPLRHPGAGPPVVVLVTIDALRADVVLEDRKATTNLRRLGHRGAVFTQARSAASATNPAISALFTGKYYSSLYWTKTPIAGKQKYFPAKDDSVRFPELLGEHGMRRAIAMTGEGFASKYGLALGFDEAFEPVKKASETVGRIEQWLRGLRSDEGGLVYAHLLDAHFPYDTGGSRGSEFDRYLGEVGVVDKQIGRLYDLIDKPGLRGRTYLIVSADHGEAFGEHGKLRHGNSVYEELVHVPLVIVGPGVRARQVDEPVSLIDLAPTILDIFGIETPGTFMGESLVPVLAGQAPAFTRPIVVDTDCAKQAMVDRDGMKLIRDRHGAVLELYDLRTDPAELRNLADDRPEEARKRSATLAGLLRAHEVSKVGYKTPYRP